MLLLLLGGAFCHASDPKYLQFVSAAQVLLSRLIFCELITGSQNENSRAGAPARFQGGKQDDRCIKTTGKRRKTG